MGDIVPVTHRKVPNLISSDRGITNHYMEIINRRIDWQKGQCSFTLLYTSFEDIRYALISPSGNLVSGTTNTLTLQAGQGAKFRAGWGVDIFTRKMLAVGTNYTVSSMSSDTMNLTTDLASAAVAGYKVGFSDYDNTNEEQHDNFAFLCGATTTVGASSDIPYLIY